MEFQGRQVQDAWSVHAGRPGAQTDCGECRKDSGVLDEVPGAYKDIDRVIAQQADLVAVRHTLKQVMCVKG